MQKIRDYIYDGTMGRDRHGYYIYTLGVHKRRWESGDYEKTIELAEARVHELKGGFAGFHIAAATRPDSEKNVAEAPPWKIYIEIIEPDAITKFGENAFIERYSTWGVFYNNPHWELIATGLPRVSDLEALVYRNKFDKIMVYRCIPKLHCLESCQLKLWGEDGVKLVG
jgi:hypothetical protein